MGMVVLVPFDGTTLSRSALRRGATLAGAFEEALVAATVLPRNNDEYAREKGWLGPGEAVEAGKEGVGDVVRERLGADVRALAPDAEFRVVPVDRSATPGTISNRLRALAIDIGASTVVVGSESAGHFATSLSSVGGGVATDRRYDVFIVRRPDPEVADLGPVFEKRG